MAASSLLRSFTRRSCAGPSAFAYRHHQRQQPWSPFSTSAAAVTQDEAAKRFPGLGPTAKGEKARVVVLGTGWAGSRLMKDLDTQGYDVVCVAPRNHMVFTPLLASTCVGTLEFRSVAEPVARIQPAVSKSPGSYFLLARCTGVDPDGHTMVRKIPWSHGNSRLLMTSWFLPVELRHQLLGYMVLPTMQSFFAKFIMLKRFGDGSSLI
ncbi:Internal alternative NAD(P)H-ubiquinone oxidoreductase A1 mitochondrial [Zea mays]|uniref:Internal alternative NAD(P)H-ubiquinone oxidoreductase A1 mitochondrial n=1 Tax=Zea mays TaxID=4577 RepID=A0A1D6G8Y6_MAIZE|nr:Internal alternative NAD(P)H-ubiquinone oxidoreductase A1 mitochondrial [Zea mays]